MIKQLQAFRKRKVKQREMTKDCVEILDEQIKEPSSYRLTLESKHPIQLQFKNYKKIHHAQLGHDLSGYQYTLNGKEYTDVSCFNAKGEEKERIEDIADFAYITEDIYGSKVLCVGRNLPAFDSSDREWDSCVAEYLMFDGKDINLIVMRGGYKIAYLTFYTKLISADIELKAWFERLGFPVDRVEWREREV